MSIDKLGVIILNWQNSKDTIACVQYIVDNWKTQPQQIIVVDNHSNHVELTTLKSAQLPIQLIENQENLGFSGGNNIGIMATHTAHCDSILLLNNDAHISQDSLQLLITTLMSSTNIAAVGPLLYEDDSLIGAGGRNIIFHRDTHLDTPVDVCEPYDVTYVPGTVILLKTTALDKIGLLDEQYFFSGEIADLCQRFNNAGYRCVINPQSSANHVIDHTTSLRRTVYQYYSLRNRFLFIRKFYPSRQLLYIGMWTMYGILKTIISLLKRDTAEARCYWMGFIDGLAEHYGNQNHRIIGIE